ncbi:MAG: type II secretion system protein GspM [Granulosicoccaceae bacterium]
MKDWYQSHSPREQIMLLAAGVAIVIGLIYALALQPLYDGLEERQSRVEGNSNSLVWMQSAASEALSLKGNSANTGPVDTSQAPLTAVARIFREAGLPAPNRVDPVGSKGARVQLAEIDFDKLVPVLDSLERQAGLQVKSLNVNSQRPGVVSARISLER